MASITNTSSKKGGRRRSSSGGSRTPRTTNTTTTATNKNTHRQDFPGGHHHHHRRRRHHHHHHHHDSSSNNNTMMVGAIDRPLPIASAIQGIWKSRRTIHRTLRRIATLTTSKRHYQSQQQQQQQRQSQQHYYYDDPILDNASSAQLCIAGDEYIVVGNTLASGLHIFRLTASSSSSSSSSSQPNQNQQQQQQQQQQPSSTSTNSTTAVDDSLLVTPWAVVPLMRNDSTVNGTEVETNNATSSSSSSPSLPSSSSSSYNSNATIVSITALPFGQSLIYGDNLRKEEGHVVIMTDDGRGIIIRIRKNDSATKIFEFSTMNFGVTCACILSVPSNTTNHNTIIKKKESTEDCQLLVGYQLGYIENWKVFRFSTEKILAKMLWRGIFPNHHVIQRMAPMNVTTSTTNTTTINYDDNDDDDNNDNEANTNQEQVIIMQNDKNGEEEQDQNNNARKSPNMKKDIDTMDNSSQIQSPPPKRKTSSSSSSSKKETPAKTITSPPPPTTTTTATNTPDKKDTPRYLLVTLYSPTYTPPKTSAMVEVIDIGSMINDWKNKDPTREDRGRLRAINLGKRWIMPIPERELLNSMSIGTAVDNNDNNDNNNNNQHEDHRHGTHCLPRRAHAIPSTATGSICEHPQGNCVALADGTIALLSSTEKCGELQWGVANDYNQLLLPYPVIGCASLYLGPSRHQQPKPHVACCLRGGSSYLIPFVSANEDDTINRNDDATDSTTPITVFTLDTETHAKFVQGFTAGNLIIPSPTIATSSDFSSDTLKGNVTTTTTSTPVLIYGWAGGLIDVFSCDLMMETTIAATTTTTTAGNTAMALSSSRRPMIGHREMLALDRLVSNGTTALLGKYLASVEDTELLLRRSMWKDAWEEFRKESSLSSSSSLEQVSAKDLMSPKWGATRSLLLLLSTSSHELPDSSHN